MQLVQKPRRKNPVNAQERMASLGFHDAAFGASMFHTMSHVVSVPKSKHEKANGKQSTMNLQQIILSAPILRAFGNTSG